MHSLSPLSRLRKWDRITISEPAATLEDKNRFEMAIRFFKTILCVLMILPLAAWGQIRAELNPQRAFPDSIPAGNYSGITWLGGDRYAVVSDKSETDGFFLFEIKTDSTTGALLSARSLGFRSSGQPARDCEGIAFDRKNQRIYVSGEADNRVKQYTLDGQLTGAEAVMPDSYRHLPANEGLEALSFNDSTGLLWTCNECDSVVITSFGADLKPLHQYRYPMDASTADASKAKFGTFGVPTLCALDDGTLLVMEREAYVPHSKIGAWVKCKIYHYVPGLNASKTLLCQWTTRLTLLGWNFANYEGVCLGPRLKDGSRLLVLVADSQNQYAGVLKDWLKTIRIY
jgi:hypothetical protein